METKKPVAGYYCSKHLFGRSALVRNGSKLYYLQWQKDKHKDIDDVIYLTKEQYFAIKALLLEIKTKTVSENSDVSQSATFIHYSTPANYMHVKRYLIKNKLMKENPNGNHITTSH